MRILTLVTGAKALADATRLAQEIRTFNAEIDFRLRFLHVEIAERRAVPAGLLEAAGATAAEDDVFEVPLDEPLGAAAQLALALARHTPEVFVLVGDGELLAAGRAAARACGTAVAYFGVPAKIAAGGLDLGTEPGIAVERLTGVAREIR